MSFLIKVIICHSLMLFNCIFLHEQSLPSIVRAWSLIYDIFNTEGTD